MKVGAGRRFWFWGAVAPLVAVAVYAALAMPELSLVEAYQNEAGWQRQAFWQLMLPRLVLGLGVGAILAMAGATLQGLLRNPLADPFVLGVSGGAAVGSALMGFWGPGGLLLAPVGGFLGALVALGVVLGAGGGRGRSPLQLLLVGVVVNALAGAVLMVLTALLEAQTVQQTLVHLMGALGADPQQRWAPWLILGLAVLMLGVLWPQARALNVLAMGDEAAETLGISPRRLRWRLLVMVSVPVGVVVAYTGLIGFVGLMVPHGLRRVVGPNMVLLLPLSAAVGAAVLVCMDAVMSHLAPWMGTELPVGAMSALLGGPFFLWLLNHKAEGRQ